MRLHRRRHLAGIGNTQRDSLRHRVIQSGFSNESIPGNGRTFDREQRPSGQGECCIRSNVAKGMLPPEHSPCRQLGRVTDGNIRPGA